MKTCNKCNVSKDESEYKKDARNKSGLQGICKECNKKWQQGRRAQIQQGIGLKSVTHKQCNECKETKEVNLFYKDTGSIDGHHSLCKECRNKTMSEWRNKNRSRYNENMREWRKNNPDEVKDHDLRRCYGIGLEDYKRMLEEQKHVCKICKKPPQGIRPLVVDHHHASGKVRGLLCYGCNRKIAILDASKEEQQAAEEYVNNTSKV
jgi:Recombination endonuclease VII